MARKIQQGVYQSTYALRSKFSSEKKVQKEEGFTLHRLFVRDLPLQVLLIITSTCLDYICQLGAAADVFNSKTCSFKEISLKDQTVSDPSGFIAESDGF